MTFETGDIIRFKGAFLRATRWYLDVPVNGRVLAVKNDGPAPPRLQVEWSDGEKTTVLASNVEPCPRAARAS